MCHLVSNANEYNAASSLNGISVLALLFMLVSALALSLLFTLLFVFIIYLHSRVFVVWHLLWAYVAFNRTDYFEQPLGILLTVLRRLTRLESSVRDL